jgi:tRNA pseudouridine55 synthase
LAELFGFLNIDKPKGITSHDVVSQVRPLSRKSKQTDKVGHAGTLDPLATGVLILCIGQATRLSEYAMQSTKEYRAFVHFGVETATYDAEGDILSQKEVSLTPSQIEESFRPYIGAIQQIPPIYSAIKKDGQKLYDIARAGGTVELEPRSVTIHSIKLVDWQSPIATIDVVCSAGTYIRSLAHDLGAALNTGAHLSGLIRSRSGGFSLENAVSLESLLQDEAWTQHLVSPKQALSDWQSIELSPEDAQELKLGRFIPKADKLENPYVMAYLDKTLYAILENRGSQWKPHKVFLPQA